MALKPWHLPQLLSIVGFAWLPVWLGRAVLPPGMRVALYAASAMMVLTFFFATWNETRAWSEWSMLFAIPAAVELESILSGESNSHGADLKSTADSAVFQRLKVLPMEDEADCPAGTSDVR